MARWLTITAKDLIKTASLSDFDKNKPLSFKLSVNCNPTKMHSYTSFTCEVAGISVPQASVPASANYFRTSLPGLTSFLIIITKIVVFWAYCLEEHLFCCSNGKRLCTISHIWSYFIVQVVTHSNPYWWKANGCFCFTFF